MPICISAPLKKLLGQSSEADEVVYLVYERHKHLGRQIPAFFNMIRQRIQEGEEPWKAIKVFEGYPNPNGAK
jgi:hypothetical protein